MTGHSTYWTAPSTSQKVNCWETVFLYLPHHHPSQHHGCVWGPQLQVFDVSQVSKTPGMPTSTPFGAAANVIGRENDTSWRGARQQPRPQQLPAWPLEVSLIPAGNDNPKSGIPILWCQTDLLLSPSSVCYSNQVTTRQRNQILSQALQYRALRHKTTAFSALGPLPRQNTCRRASCRLPGRNATAEFSGLRPKHQQGIRPM